MNVIATCPGPNCGWQEPIIVSLLVCNVYGPPNWFERLIGRTEAQVRSQRSGRLCRCPMCKTLYVVTKDGARRCAPEEPVQAQPKSDDVRPPRQAQSFPSLPDDMVRAFNAREPR